MHTPRDKRVYQKEAISLASAGFEVVHLCPGSVSLSGLHDGVNTITYAIPKGLLGRIKQLLFLFKNAKSINADAYHCNEVDSWILGIILKILYKKKCIFDVHEHYPSTFSQSRFPLILQPFISGFIKLIFILLGPFTDMFVLAKKSVSNDFKVSKDKKILVRNYASLSAFSKIDCKTTTDLSRNSTFRLIHLGLFSKKRGWPQILESLSLMKNKNLEFIAIGEINDGSFPDFHKMVNDLGLSNRVTFLDWMAYDEVLDYLISSDIGIIAFQPHILNHVYAMPHKMFDYMASSLAVILPNFAEEVSPIIDEENCGILVDTSSPLEISTALDELLDNPAKLRAMGSNGSEAIKKSYNWENESQKLIEMYRSL